MIIYGINPVAEAIKAGTVREIRVAERADEHPKVFNQVKLVYTVRGRKLSKALVERAVALSDEKYCSATAMVRKSANITHEVVLVEV